MSAYDLLPADEREAIAWVRAHGGLDAVRSSVEQGIREHGYLCEIAAMLGTSIYDGTDNADDLLDKLYKRLMPEGMEWLVEAWPRFEDGDPVRFLDDFECYGEENGVSVVTMYSDGSFALNCRAYSKGERVKRPASKVLDADGAEIRVGDKVWDVDGSGPFEVRKINGCSVTMTNGHYYSSTFPRYCPSHLTHRAPVLAADGRPLREGETVYLTGSPTAFVVDDIMTREDGATVVHLADGAWHLPQDLTHERPDSWERLEEDVANASCPDVYCANHHIDASDASYEWAMARDIVRRAKALAERDR